MTGIDGVDLALLVSLLALYGLGAFLVALLADVVLGGARLSVPPGKQTAFVVESAMWFGVLAGEGTAAAILSTRHWFLWPSVALVAALVALLWVLIRRTLQGAAFLGAIP